MPQSHCNESRCQDKANTVLISLTSDCAVRNVCDGVGHTGGHCGGRGLFERKATKTPVGGTRWIRSEMTLKIWPYEEAIPAYTYMRTTIPTTVAALGAIVHLMTHAILVVICHTRRKLVTNFCRGSRRATLARIRVTLAPNRIGTERRLTFTLHTGVL